jgi:hypothetical protein
MITTNSILSGTYRSAFGMLFSDVYAFTAHMRALDTNVFNQLEFAR